MLLERQTSAVISLAEDFVSLARNSVGAWTSSARSSFLLSQTRYLQRWSAQGDCLLPKGIPGGEMKDTPGENTAR